MAAVPAAGARQRAWTDVLNSERLTIKAAEAIQAAANDAQRRGNPTLEDLHLLSALLTQDDTVVVPILEKVGVNIARLQDGLRVGLERLPKQSGGGAAPSMSRELSQVLDLAEKEAHGLKDEYVST